MTILLNADDYIFQDEQIRRFNLLLLCAFLYKIWIFVAFELNNSGLIVVFTFGIIHVLKPFWLFFSLEYLVNLWSSIQFNCLMGEMIAFSMKLGDRYFSVNHVFVFS